MHINSNQVNVCTQQHRRVLSKAGGTRERENIRIQRKRGGER
jgi:hypothetical protein